MVKSLVTRAAMQPACPSSRLRPIRNSRVLKDTLPKTKRVAMIFDPKNRGMMIRLKAIEAAAARLAIELQTIPALSSNELEAALSLRCDRSA